MGNVYNGLQIEALLSVSPSKFTEPRQVRRVSTATKLDPSKSDNLRGCLNTLLYYNKERGEDSGSLHAGWIKESLGRALLEQPLFSGRLKRQTDDDKVLADKRLEIVSNDSGVRLVEARMPFTLSEFLDSKTRNEAETELVYWSDVDGEDPRFCPLFYLQVTNFECGGYSFGISCSLLLADLLFKENFLKRWGEIHKNIMVCSSNDVVEGSPIFYLPNFKRDGPRSMPSFASNPSRKNGQTRIFIANNNTALESNTRVENESKYYSSLALLCIATESELCDNNHKMASDSFSLFVTEPDHVMVEKCSKHGIVKPELLSLESNGITRSNWDEIGAYEVEFRHGNLPLHVSYWIGSVSEQIFMVIPSSDKDISGTKIIMTVPNEKQS